MANPSDYTYEGVMGKLMTDENQRPMMRDPETFRQYPYDPTGNYGRFMDETTSQLVGRVGADVRSRPGYEPAVTPWGAPAKEWLYKTLNLGGDKKQGLERLAATPSESGTFWQKAFPGVPRSKEAIDNAVQKFIAENPDATFEEIAAYRAKLEN